MAEPEWTIPFVPLPDWSRSAPPAEFQQRVERYAAIRRANMKDWEWSDVGDNLTKSDHKRIRDEAVRQGLIPVVPVDSATRFPDFGDHVLTEVQLDPQFWMSTDAVQFRELNRQFGGETPPGYTWHHHQDSGRMQLVPFGVHNSTSHNGGRTTWSLGPRK